MFRFSSIFVFHGSEDGIRAVFRRDLGGQQAFIPAIGLHECLCGQQLLIRLQHPHHRHLPPLPNIRSSILLYNSRVDDGLDWSSPYYPYSGEATAQRNSNYSNSSYDSSPKEMEHAQVIARLRQQYGNVSYSVGYGSQCTNASTLVSPWAFREKVAGFMVKSKGHFQKLQQRSRAWYGGQDSALIAAWWEMYRRKKKFIKKGPNF